MKPPNTVEQFFARNTPRDFPLPKRRKPYTRVVRFRFAQWVVESHYKTTGAGKIILLEVDEVSDILYFQAITWQELETEARLLVELIKKGG